MACSTEVLSQILSGRTPKLKPISHQQFERENAPMIGFRTDFAQDLHTSGIGTLRYRFPFSIRFNGM